MRSGGSKAKGSAFEREVCKKLSLWASNGIRQDLYWRSAMSGGRATIQLNQGKLNQTQIGDISSIDRLGQELTDKFILELKFYKVLDLIPGIVHNRGVLHTFWTKLVKDSKVSKKQPALICKQNHLPPLLLVSPLGASLLNVKKEFWIATITKWQCEVYLFEGLLKSECPFN